MPGVTMSRIEATTTRTTATSTAVNPAGEE